MPNSPATTEPTTTPMTGAQRRSAPVAFSASPIMTSTVTRALCGTSLSVSKTMGITVTAISMITVPATVGVSTRRNSESRAASTN